MINFNNGIFALGVLIGVLISLALYLILGENFFTEAFEASVMIPSIIGAGSVFAALWVYIKQNNADLYRSAEAIRVSIVPKSYLCEKIAEEFIKLSEMFGSGEHPLHPVLHLSEEFQSIPTLKMNSYEIAKLIDIIDKDVFGEIITLEYKIEIANNILNRLFKARYAIIERNFGGPHPGVRGAYFVEHDKLASANEEAEKFDDQIKYLLGVLGHICDMIGKINLEIMSITRPNAPLTDKSIPT